MFEADSKQITPEGRSETRCSHCGRLVRETTHTRSEYQVDYYELHTGQVEPTPFRRGEDGPVEIYQRLLIPELVITCADCYRSPEVQDEREQRYRPEHYESMGEVSP